MQTGTITLEDFCAVLQAKPEEFSKVFKDKLQSYDLSYSILSSAERDEHILSTLKLLKEGVATSGPHKKVRWEAGWGENYEEYKNSGFNKQALIPKYYYSGNNKIMRWRNNFVRPNHKDFEIIFWDLIRTWVCDRFVAKADSIYEFGCGPGHNLIEFAECYPEKKFMGLDWAQASQSVIAEIASHTGFKIQGKNFDLFHPSEDLKLEPNSLVLTFGSLEQLGKNHTAFLDYLLQQPCEVYLHLEPIAELNDDSLLMDYLASEYMSAKNYLEGYLNSLRNNPQVEILRSSKVMGSKFYDGWNLIVWRKKS